MVVLRVGREQPDQIRLRLIRCLGLEEDRKQRRIRSFGLKSGPTLTGSLEEIGKDEVVVQEQNGAFRTFSIVDLNLLKY